MTRRGKAKTRRVVAEYFSFPLNISRIREEYAAKGYFSSGEQTKLQSPDRFSPMEMAGQRGEGDLIPVVSPGPSAVGGELALSQSLLALERGRFNWAAITATNTYDRLFLAEKVRARVPRYTTLFHDRFDSRRPSHGHPLSARDASSSRPIHSTRSHRHGRPRRDGKTGKRVTKISFGNYFEEGIYNATVAHLSDLNLDKTPDLLDYAYPGSGAEGGSGSVGLDQRHWPTQPLSARSRGTRGRLESRTRYQVSRPRRHLRCPAERSYRQRK